MKFALLGDHADGVDVTRALTANRRHELAAYSGPLLGADVLQRAGLSPKRVGDWEDVLADPDIAFVVVAGSLAARGAMLRRAVQSERHVLCVHPADPKPDLAFEAALMQADTGCVVWPLLAEAFHPGVARFAQLARDRGQGVLEIRRASPEEFWLGTDGDDPKPGLPGWDVLRRIGGEIVEVFGLAADEEPMRGQPLLVMGRFADGSLFHAAYQANQPDNFWRIALAGPRPLALVFPDGWPGPATLTHEDDTGALRTENWPAQAPWAPLIEAFEGAMMKRPQRRPSQAPGVTDERCWTTSGADDNTAAIQAADTMIGAAQREPGPRLGWTDEIRALELDDSIRRSLHYRRSYTLDLQDATEEASFKGTMTLVGCSLMWITLVLLFLSIWFPWMGWLIFPALGVFLVMQLLRHFVRDKKATDKPV
jgi:predicted dehydrogenase